MLRTFAVVFGIWGLGLWLERFFYMPWYLWMIISAVGCLIVTIHPAARMQAIIGGTFLSTFVLHGAFGISFIMERKTDLETYVFIGSAINYARISLCLLWGVGRIAKIGGIRLVPSRHTEIVQPTLANVE